MNTLQIDSIQKSLNHKLLLSDIYIKCQSTDVVGIFGFNGSGKSTLLKIIFGTESCYQKNIQVNGKVIKTPSKQIAILPQDSFIPWNLRVEDAVNLCIDNYKQNDFYADDFLFALKRRKIKELSGGERRYVEAKIILYSDAQFLLLDEPFNKLSPILTESLMIEILKVSSSKGIIITDHKYEEVMKISTKKYFLKNGKLLEFNNLEKLTEFTYIK